MGNNKNKLWEEDATLFQNMKSHYSSHEEENFFKTMQYKEEYEPALANDLIISENDNSDKLYLVRELYDEYVIGIAGEEDKEVHVMNLSEALSTKLSSLGYSGLDLTLLDWLREQKYNCVQYDRNFDLM